MLVIATLVLVAGGIWLITIDKGEGEATARGAGFFLIFLTVFPAVMLVVELMRRRRGRY